MTNKKINLLFITDYMECGGRERVIIYLLNHLNRSKFDSSLLLIEKKGEFLNKVREDVKIKNLMKTNTLRDEIFLARAFRYMQRVYNVCKIINSEKPDIVFTPSTTISPLAIFAKLFARKTRVIINVQGNLTADLKQNLKNKFFLERIISILIYRMYRMADKVICVSKGVGEDLNKKFCVPKDKIVVIYNPIDVEEINKLQNEEIDDLYFENDNLKIISVGRLHIQKAYEYLIEAFKVVRENEINANLIIIGEGIERANLENLVDDLGLGDCVIMPGFKKNPYKYIKNSDLFVLSSIFEGHPLALSEAMACGVPVISTRCPSGPDETITDNVNGMLVPMRNEKALADAMINLLKDRSTAERLAKEGIKRANDFDLKKIVKEYEKVLIDVISKK
ncbi:MAG: hypothetical protein CVT89_00135 [Candidatus Altiarchaeales archaeon HGW-Altiarchaeales-2]|nr:MAG: hypothetical protein CVT89_00135 [Candidatus Altiarchaeales archaeon HGW-Altiarchaeales-2]